MARAKAAERREDEAELRVVDQERRTLHRERMRCFDAVHQRFQARQLETPGAGQE